MNDSVTPPPDYSPPSSPQPTDSAEANKVDKSAVRRKAGLRLLYLLLFGIFYGLAELILLVVVVMQYGFVLINGERNERLLEFGASLSKYCYQIMRFFVFDLEQKPFPFARWPSPAAADQDL